MAAAAAAPIHPASLKHGDPLTTDGATGLESVFQEQYFLCTALENEQGNIHLDIHIF
jgi:hypothetical protein